MTRTIVTLLAGWTVVAAAVSGRPQAAAAPPAQPSAATAPASVAPRAVVDKYCITCHNQRTKAGGLILDAADLTSPPASAETWEKVIRKVRGGMMPPVGMPRPDRAALDGLASYLETSIDAFAAAHPNPGRTVLHRLNRAEYGNAIRDLLALDVDVTSLLPADDSAYGFDNIGDVLGVSPMLMERYLSAAWKVSGLAVGNTKAAPTVETFRVRSDLSQNDHIEGLPIGTRGGLLIRYTFPVDGEYVIQPRLYRETVNIIRGLEVPHDLEITFDGERIHLARFGGAEDEKANYLNPTAAGDDLETRFRLRIPVKAGPHSLGVSFLKKSSAPTVELLQPFLRERIDPITPVGIPEVDKVTIEGPFNVTSAGDSPSRRQIFACRPASNPGPQVIPARAVSGADRGDRLSGRDNDAACAKTVLSALARRAYRRPPTVPEIDRLLGFYNSGKQTGGSFDTGIENALAFMLVSPQFLYRFERDPDEASSDGVYRLTDLELASRLSFFIWSSIPDDQLLNLAVAGKLRNQGVLDQQVKRMLADERARALGSNFAGQWLYLRNLKSLRPDEDVFPDFDDNLRQALQRETEMLFEHIVLQDKSVLDLLSADYTFLNERLARHYGIPNVYGGQFRRVAVRDDYRRGLIGHGSILALNSYGNRTSPVTRGKYVLSNILGTPPPPPPDNVPPLDEKPGKASSMRERMEEHRSNPACAGCHKLMDPIGLALENFDGIGRWRTSDSGVRIDASSTLWDGTAIDGPAGLRRAILARPDQFARTATEMLLTYALGRGLEHTDMPVVRSIVKESAAQNYRFSSLVTGIVKSAPFQMRMTQGDR
jgi:mono/diheme cytochrome c family protein